MADNEQKFLDKEGLRNVWDKIRQKFAGSLQINGKTISLMNRAETPGALSTITLPDVSTTTDGLMSSTDKQNLDAAIEKLADIDSGADVNQNAFSIVKVAGTNLQADSPTDTLTITAGNSNITLTPNQSGDSFSISAANTTYTLTQDANDGHKITLTPSSGNATTITIPDNNTTYEVKSAASGGTDASLVTTGDKYTWNTASNKVNNMATVTYGTCSTAANQRAKTVTISNSNWQLAVGSIVGVKFTNTNTVNVTGSSNYVTLAVGSTQAKQIYYKDAANPLGVSTIPYGRKNYVNYYMYDGTYWVFLSSDVDYESLSAASGGTDLSLVTTGEKYTWNNKASTAVATASSAGLMSAADYTLLHTDASASSKGLMSADDYTFLHNIPGTYATKTEISGVYKYQNSVENASDLPQNLDTSHKGYVYNIKNLSTLGPAGTNVAWTGTQWDALGGLFVVPVISDTEITTICV